MANLEVRSTEFHLSDLNTADPMSVQCELYAGNRILLVNIHKRDGSIFADSKVSTEPFKVSERTPGSTTAVYQREAEILREACRYSPDGMVTYRFSTRNPEMKAWAQDPGKGEGIFHWDSLYERDDDKSLYEGRERVFEAVKTFDIEEEDRRPKDGYINVQGFEVPRIEGHAYAQQVHTLSNWIVGGLIDNPWIIESQVRSANLNERKLTEFLTWVNSTYSPELVFYPLSGWHTNPRDTFGEEKVVHLSNDNKHPYLYHMEHGMRVKGDIHKTPFRGGMFDAVFLRPGPLRFEDKYVNLEQLLEESRRVVKPDGLFIVEVQSNPNMTALCRQNLDRVQIPDDISQASSGLFELYLNRDKTVEPTPPAQPKRKWWQRFI